MNIEKDIEKLIALVKKRHRLKDQIEDWEYLIHHIEVINGIEELHHCFLLDHLGNKYKIDHTINREGKLQHYIVGLVEDQDVFWSDQEAIEAGYTIPCPARQLE